MARKKRRKSSKTKQITKAQAKALGYTERQRKAANRVIKARRMKNPILIGSIKKKKVRRTMARRKKYRRAPKQMSSNMKLLWNMTGAAGSGIMEGLINSFLPSIGGNLAAALGGMALTKFTKGIPKQMGKGMLIKAGGDFLEENVVPNIPYLSNLGGGMSSNSTQTTTNTTQVI